MPQITLDLQKLGYNAKKINEILSKRNISLIAVSKVVLGSPQIAKAFISSGIQYIGDSRIENIIKMKEHNINAKFFLIRVPSLEELPKVVKYADYSLNSELITIKMLSSEAKRQNKKHNIILMIDVGDLREGINIDSINYYVSEILKLDNIKLSGIGTNLKCFGGVVPTQDNMTEFSNLAEKIQTDFGIELKFVSGGNSANFKWLFSNKDYGLINNLRIGESIFFGTETINFDPISDLFTDALILSAEIMETKKRRTIPKGTVVSNAFGEPKTISKNYIKDHNNKIPTRNQALLNIGRQDVAINGLRPLESVEILGASSDYLIIDLLDNSYQIGDTLQFSLNYEALLGVMTSPFIKKNFKK